MALLTDSGRAAVATSIKQNPIHLAWGSGSVDWDASQPPESIGTSTLLAEVGRRKVTQAMFCTPDPLGEIVVSQGRFSLSTEATNYLYLRFAFDFLDAQDATIRELGVFVGTEAKSTTPEGQDYLLPEDIEDPGTMLVLEYVEKLVRSPQIRQQFEFVVQF
ncbi:TPA: hypothetical protein L9M48_004888 [Klebsiella pneumoniae]|uniref:hypothetical protein n=1 Tax=Enterobacteriaceae TaxID=543 RepID=UPI0008597617|nr:MULTISPECIES: hypothetical protein [Enterobacteriaceae]MBW9589132.1 hypothetical protein [Escherichia coli]MBW9627811.1 hypothetical protein [Escherichia coli]MCP6775029.1 hypothetical protein [Klebsiella pneumoniae]OEJ71767.1 hypothetical protein BHU60_23165 [Klebsiella pneumoniae]HBR1863909.1 hypothetical protein [Klebsiella pneumoniae]